MVLVVAVVLVGTVSVVVLLIPSLSAPRPASMPGREDGARALRPGRLRGLTRNRRRTGRGPRQTRGETAASPGGVPEGPVTALQRGSSSVDIAGGVRGVGALTSREPAPFSSVRTAAIAS